MSKFISSIPLLNFNTGTFFYYSTKMNRPYFSTFCLVSVLVLSIILKESSCQRDDFNNHQSSPVVHQDVSLWGKDSGVSSILAREKRQFLGTTCAIGRESHCRQVCRRRNCFTGSCFRNRCSCFHRNNRRCL